MKTQTVAKLNCIISEFYNLKKNASFYKNFEIVFRRTSVLFNEAVIIICFEFWGHDCTFKACMRTIYRSWFMKKDPVTKDVQVKTSLYNSVYFPFAYYHSACDKP